LKEIMMMAESMLSCDIRAGVPCRLLF
jgi:hypothetical protein